MHDRRNMALDRDGAAGLPAADYYNGPGYGPRLYGYAETEEPAGFDPLRLLFYVVEYRWLIAILLAVGLVTGLTITMMQTPKYQATSRLEVQIPSARVFQDMELVSESSDIRAFLTARERLKSRALAQRVVLGLGLSERATFLFPAPDFSVGNIFRRAFGASAPKALDDYTPEEREEIAINRIVGNLTVDLVTNTSLLSINYRDQDRRIAQEIANQIAQSYIDQRVDQTGATSELARQFIQDQVGQVKAKLQASEQELVDYAKEAGITVTGAEGTLIENSMQAINASLSKAVEDRLNQERLVQQIDAGRGASLEQVLVSDGLQKLRGEIAARSAEYQQKLGTFKPGFPEMVQLQAQIKELRKQYDGGVAIITDGVRLKLDDAISREADLKQKLAEMQAEQAAYQDKNIRYTILKREVDSNRTQYQSLIGKLNEAGVASELRQQNAVIVDLAPLPRFPVSPRLSINLAIAIMLFAALAAAIIYVLELLNNTFVNPDQVEKELQLPVMGVLPEVDAELLVASIADPTSALSEAYRSLRTALQFSGSDGAPKTLVVTSSEPSEGKSTTVFKLARDFGVLGQKVLVIDGDLRKPNVHRQFSIDNTLGLSNLLTNTVRAEDLPGVVRQTKEENVWAITSGTIPPNPADLLSSQRMAQLIERMSQRFDLVLIDAPPVVGLSDAPILSRLAHGTLLVVCANKVTRKSAKNALKRLKSAGAQVVGVALSKFSVGKFDYSYAYRYMNYHYYNYGGETPKLEGQGGDSQSEAQQPAHKHRNLVGRARAVLARLGRRLKPVG